MHGTLRNKHHSRFGGWLHGLVEAIEGLAHDVLSPPIWRIVLTVISAVTTTRGLMLLYGTFGEVEHGKESIGFLTWLVPLGVSGALHALIFFLLWRWAATARRKYLALAVPLQVLAVLASFGTHWLHMESGGATKDSYTVALDAADRGMRVVEVSYEVVDAEMTMAAAHSDAMAAIEEKGGGNSCGQAVGNGTGPRYDLRKADRTTFTGFKADVAARKGEVAKLVERAHTLTAGSADQAMERLTELRNLVNEAKARFEPDVLLDQVRRAAEARILLGRSAIAIPPARRGRSGQAQFTCPDPVLERRLQAVIDAIKNVKPLPEVRVSDFREAHIGFPAALARLGKHLSGFFNTSLPNRGNLQAQRVRTLSGAPVAQEEGSLQELAPLAMAGAIEFFLTLLFGAARGRLPRHPGFEGIDEVVNDPTGCGKFDQVWQALGAGTNHGALCDAFDAHAQFEGRSTIIFVPVYSDAPPARALHKMMELLVGVGFARHVYTGRGFSAWWQMRGWYHARREQMRGRTVRIYRMSARDYLAFILDGAGRAQASSVPPEPAANNELGASTDTTAREAARSTVPVA